SEKLIAETLYPYPENLVIATKGGLTRPGPGQWVPDGRPEHLRRACEGTGAILGVLAAARRHRVSERQVALASLLTRSPHVLPIPGSGDPDHVEQNIAAAS